MASSQLTNVILSEVPRERAGSASGVATTNNALGAALGVALLGAVLRVGTFSDAGSARWALLTAAALLAAGSAASFSIPTTRPGDDAHSEPAAGPANLLDDRHRDRLTIRPSRAWPTSVGRRPGPSATITE
jgi:hypothetical protein